MNENSWTDTAPEAPATVGGAVTLGGVTYDVLVSLTARPEPTPVPVPVPVPVPTPTVINVRDSGARGDGTTDDAPAINAAFSRATSGQTIYFPAGTYRVGSPPLVTKPLTLSGDGATSVLKHDNVNGIEIALNLSGVKITRLAFQGQPGRYWKDGNVAKAIQTNGPAGVLIEDCDFRGCGYAYFSGATGIPSDNPNAVQWPVGIRNCRVQGWGWIATFLRGGEQIQSCRFVQDDPDVTGRRSQHGVYIVSGAKNVTVADTVIENSRWYGIQIYGQLATGSISNVNLYRCTLRNCQAGIIFANTAPLSILRVDSCQILGSYADPALRIAGYGGADGVNFTNNVIDGGPWGMVLQGKVTNLTAQTNQVRNCNVGIQVWPTASFTNVLLSGNPVTNCRTAIDLAGAAGIRVV